MEYIDQVKYIVSICKALFPIIIALLGSLSWIHFLLYNKNPRYYMFFMKILSRWKDTNWRLSVIYMVQRDKDIFKIFEDVISHIYGEDSYRKRVNLSNKKMYEFDGYSLILQHNLDESEDNEVKVEFHFSNMNVTYKNSRNRLEALQRIFHQLEERVRFVDKTYNLKINFENKLRNPFYGVAIKHLGEEHILNFECTFPMSVIDVRFNQEAMLSDGVIHVFKNGININNSDFDIVKDCAQKCLLLE